MVAGVKGTGSICRAASRERGLRVVGGVKGRGLATEVAVWDEEAAMEAAAAGVCGGGGLPSWRRWRGPVTVAWVEDWSGAAAAA
jgi:hypothetical protein